MLGVQDASTSCEVDDDPAERDAWFTAWRARELSRLERSGLAYLDFTGAALYPESVVRADAARLEYSLLGNPHSQHAPSREATHDMEAARRAVLDFLHADPAEYAVIFTANASAACRLVAESFPFDTNSALLLTADNHNSVNGMREYARVRGAALRGIHLDQELRLTGALAALDAAPRGGGLFAFPAQSNFSGVRHPLSLVHDARARGWRTLLDAAAYLPTADLQLDELRPDFVALSLYKIAGYPSGVGALVARHDALQALRRPSFAGGAVDWVSVEMPRHRLARWPEGFEDGTTSFLALGAIAPALAAIRAVGRHRLATHLATLTSELLAQLTSLRHSNRASVVRLHGPCNNVDRGATIALTVQTPTGEAVPHWEVEADARARGVAVRGGCFCNPGCAEHAFAFPVAQMATCLDGLGDAFTIPRLAECLGSTSVGAIRMSLGLGSVVADVRRAVEFVTRFQT